MSWLQCTIIIFSYKAKYANTAEKKKEKKEHNHRVRNIINQDNENEKPQAKIYSCIRAHTLIKMSLLFSDFMFPML